MSTLRSLRRQSMYGYQWRHGYRKRQPKPTWFQRFVVNLMSMFGRTR